MSFSRRTIMSIFGDYFSDRWSHDEIESLCLSFTLEHIAPYNPHNKSKKRRINKILEYIFNNPDQELEDGRSLTFELLKYMLNEISNEEYDESQQQFSMVIDEEIQNLLKRDGYFFSNGQLNVIMPEELILINQYESELDRLLDKFHFNTSNTHLTQARDNHARSQWESANAAIRAYYESIINDISCYLHPQNNLNVFTTQLDLLSRGPDPFIINDIGEYSNDGKNYLNGLMKRLHSNGSHAGLSDQEDTTFRLQIVLITTYYLLARLE